MSETTEQTTKATPSAPKEFRNINAFKDLRTYRLPAAGWVSILHRASGMMMFALLPLIVWFFDKSLSSEISFDVFKAAFNGGIGILPGWLVKLLALGLIWAYLHHFIAGVRHLFMDVKHSMTTKESGRRTAIFTLVLSVLLTLALGAKLYGLY